jgi:hypothetical protein
MKEQDMNATEKGLNAGKNFTSTDMTAIETEGHKQSLQYKSVSKQNEFLAGWFEAFNIKFVPDDRPEWLVQASKFVPVSLSGDENDVWINRFYAESYEIAYPMQNGKRAKQATVLTDADWAQVAERVNKK